MKKFFENVVQYFLILCILNLFYSFEGHQLFLNLSDSRKVNGFKTFYDLLQSRLITQLQTNVELQNELYTNLFVFEAKKNDDSFISFVEAIGFTFIRKVFENANYYLFRHSSCCVDDGSHAQWLLENMTKHSAIKWAEQQETLKRVHRTIQLFSRKSNQKEDDIPRRRKHIWRNRTSFVMFDDPLFKEQWYLLNRGQTGSPPENDINVLPVWESGITGEGVRISVLDDGIDPGCEEVADNYDSNLSGDFSYIHRKYTPVAENSHGTSCAAIAAGVANNEVCGVGVAFGAKIGGVRILDGPVTDAQEAMALVHALDYADIYTASWGPNDDGKNTAGPGTLAKLAFLKGVTEGRQGKGAIYVWAAGNGGRYQDNCNMDGYASSPYVLTIGALTAEGLSTYYSEPCAAVIAAAYVGGSHRPIRLKNLMRERRKIKVVVPEGRGRCRATFQGTSAAAPMAAGVVALALHANPALSWRDVRHLVVRTSRVPNAGEGGWATNAAGHPFHLRMGFGVLDAGRMVEAARTWEPAGQMRAWTSYSVGGTRFLLPHHSVSIPLQVTKSAMPTSHRIDRLESVIATIGLSHVPYGHLELYLMSPSGTVSQVLTRRPMDRRLSKISKWDFLSLHFWDEDPDGWWSLVVSNGDLFRVGKLNLFYLTFHGTATDL